MEYAVGGVYGNVAYDLSTAGYALPREEEYSRPAEQPRETVREREQVRTAVRERQAFGLPLFGVIGTVAVAVVLVMVLMAYIQLAQVSSTTTQLKNSIADLEESGTMLRVRYESTFNLNEIETYAMNVLGMTKLDDSNTTVFEVEKADKAEILNPDDSAEGILSVVSRFLDSIGEYFS